MTQKQITLSESYLTLKEVRTLISSISDARDRLMLRLLYETGCTLVELTNIKVKDVLGNKVRISGDDQRYSYISSKLAKDIRNYMLGNNLKKDTYLISTRQSSRISEKRIRQLIHKYSLSILNKKLNPQMFRYYHITHAYSNGILLETIAKQLGITAFRIFQIINELQLTKQNYNEFLKRI